MNKEKLINALNRIDALVKCSEIAERKREIKDYNLLVEYINNKFNNNKFENWLDVKVIEETLMREMGEAGIRATEKMKKEIWLDVLVSLPQIISEAIHHSPIISK